MTGDDHGHQSGITVTRAATAQTRRSRASHADHGGVAVQRHGHRPGRLRQHRHRLHAAPSTSPAATARRSCRPTTPSSAGDAGVHTFTRHAQDRGHPVDHGHRHGDRVDHRHPDASPSTPPRRRPLVVSGYPSPTTAGVALNVTVTALDAFGNTATGYRGTVHFTSSDGQAVLPANYTFIGRRRRRRTPSPASRSRRPGTQSITATDTVNGTITGTRADHGQRRADAPSLVVSGFPSPTTAGVAHNVTVTAQDAFGNTATGYTGHGPLHQQRRPGGPAGQLHLHGRRRRGAHLHQVTLKTAGSQSSRPPTRSPARSRAPRAITVKPPRRRPLTVSGSPEPDHGRERRATSRSRPRTPSATRPPATGARSTSPAATARRSCRPTTPSRPATLGAHLHRHAQDGGHPVDHGHRHGDRHDHRHPERDHGQRRPRPHARRSRASPARPRPGRPHNVTVTAQDAYGNTATGYTGTVHFTSSDGQARPAGQLHLHGRRRRGAHLHASRSRRRAPSPSRPPTR